jgi:hypothetical protein
VNDLDARVFPRPCGNLYQPIVCAAVAH